MHSQQDRILGIPLTISERNMLTLCFRLEKHMQPKHPPRRRELAGCDKFNQNNSPTKKTIRKDCLPRLIRNRQFMLRAAWATAKPTDWPSQYNDAESN